jgi:hypothetical protein
MLFVAVVLAIWFVLVFLFAMNGAFGWSIVAACSYSALSRPIVHHAPSHCAVSDTTVWKQGLGLYF